MRSTTTLLALLPILAGCSSGSSSPNAAPSGIGGESGTGGLGSGSGGAPSGGAPNGGASAGSGGVPSGDGGAGSGGAANGGAATGAGGVAASAPITDRLHVADVTTPEGVKAGVRNFRVWGQKSLGVAPVYTVPLPNCGTLVCYTTGDATSPTARAAYLDQQDQLVTTYTLEAGRECRGLAVEPDGHFGALLWDDAADKIYMKRFDAAGAPGWTTELTNADNHPDDFGLGEARVDFGGGKYGAYYHVHSDSGHEGDTLKWIAADTGAETTQWDWGCSHSMSDLLRWDQGLSTFLPACVTDCYPGTSGDFTTMSQGGLYLNHDDAKVIEMDAACNGKVAGELGSAAPSASGWKLVWNSHQAPMTQGQSSYDTATMNQDIGFSSVGSGFSKTPVVWLTTTPANEEDASIALFSPAGDGAEQYLVGWEEGGTAPVYRLARVGADGAFLENPVDVTALAKWGHRDDPFRTHLNGDVVWAWFDAAGATTLHVARVASGNPNACTR